MINSLAGIRSISAGETFSLALKNDSTVYAWGVNTSGQLGDGTNTNSNVPVQISSLTGIAAISAGGNHSFAFKSNGTVWAWGYGLQGQLGNGGNSNNNAPIQITGICIPLTTSVKSIEEKQSISVFPNPSSGIFQITLDNIQSENGLVKIYNVLGETIFSVSIVNPSTTIDLCDQPKGIYFIEIQTEQRSFTQKIIIDK